MDRSVTRYFYDHPKSRELKLQIRDDKDDPHQSDEGGKILALIPYLKEIGLRLQTVFPANFPHLGQNEESNHIHQGLVREDVQNGSTFRVSPATGPEESESGVDLSRGEQPD